MKSFFGIVFFLVSAASLHAYNCKQIGQFIDIFSRGHYAGIPFGDEYSKRTFDNLLKDLDPAKLYLLEGDVMALREAYELTLDDYVRQANCTPVNNILQTYSTRFKARQETLDELIDTDFDFTIDEYYNIDRKEREWAKTPEELDERWRKYIKYSVMRLKDRYEIEEVREKLHKRFELSRKFLFELDNTELAAILLNAYATAMDPHSKYLSRDDLEDFRISTSLSLEGVGAQLRSELGMTEVVKLIAGGPAKRGGLLKEGDKIIAVAQGDGPSVDVVDMKLRDVVKYIRGERGTEVRLTVEREEKDEIVTKVIPIIRDKIELDDNHARGFSYDVEVDGALRKFGYIDLPSFYLDFTGRNSGGSEFTSCSRDVADLIEQLKGEGIEGLTIDLRGNTGGSLDEAVSIAGLFIDLGTVVQVRGLGGRINMLADDDPGTLYDGPLVVMTNRSSASSSEILAGALKDYGRAVLIGNDRSFGKGTVQKLDEVGGGQHGAVKITISQFFRPGGSSTQKRGVETDIVLPSLYHELEVGEQFNDYCLSWQAIEPAPDYPKLGMVAPYIASLKQASSERVAQDEDFIEVLKEIEEYREGEEDRKRVSLLEEPDEDAEAADEDSEDTSEELADAETDDAESDEEDASKKRPDLAKDRELREALAILADYTRLLSGLTIADTISYPGVDLSTEETGLTADAEAKPVKSE